MRVLTVTTLPLLATLATAFHLDSNLLPRNGTTYRDSLSDNQRKLFDYAMDGLDANFAPPFIFNSPRYSAWYSVGLLARNEDDDVAIASQMIKDVVDMQFTDPTKAWFGTFRSRPDAPDPGDTYPPKLYSSYDLNMGLFVCTSWIIAMEEFQDLLEPDVVELMKRSMYNATVGDGYRVGGVNGDNLYPIYSNPWLMRVMAATYVGNMMADENMTYWGDHWGDEAIAEFDKYGTLSEFNSGTYTGVSLYALSLWGYMPENSTIASRAKDLIATTWDTVGQLWNPTLYTLGGAFDRTYGYDLRQHFGILGAQVTGLIGGIDEGTAPIPRPLVGSSHYADAAIIALTPLTAKFNDPYVSPTVVAALQSLNEPHNYSAQAISPPFDNPAYPRNYTSWTQDGLSIGGIVLDENTVGGPASNLVQFVPASVVWRTEVPGEKLGWMTLYPTSSSISAVVSSTNLTISYPPSRAFPSDATSSNVFTFLISAFKGVTLSPEFLATGSASLPGLKLSVSGSVVEEGNSSLVYGQATINDVYYYNLTWVVPEELELPTIVWKFEKL